MPTQPSNRRRGARIWLCLCLLGVALNLSAAETNVSAVAAATAVPAAAFGKVKNFFVPDYYEAPNQNQMKSLLRGAEAEPQTNGCVLIRELQVETYAPDGKLEMTVHAPECLYKAADQTASSASHIEVRSGDGKMLVEGEGFLWHNGDSTFAISNRVHTVIRPATEKLNKKPNVP